MVGHGSTNIYVTEELLGECPKREQFLSGLVVNGSLCVTQAEEKPPMIMIRKGKLILPELTMEDTLRNFGADGVFIKGANALDLQHRKAAILIGDSKAGTIGVALQAIVGRRVRLILPVGLEKRVPGDLDSLADRRR